MSQTFKVGDRVRRVRNLEDWRHYSGLPSDEAVVTYADSAFIGFKASRYAWDPSNFELVESAKPLADRIAEMEAKLAALKAQELEDQLAPVVPGAKFKDANNEYTILAVHGLRCWYSFGKGGSDSLVDRKTFLDHRFKQVTE